MIEILNSAKVLQQHLGCDFPKFQLKATSDFQQRLKFLGANFTVEKIGNEAIPLLKCADVSITSVNKYNIS